MTYGTLNAAKSNAVLICHALTGDQFVASDHPITGKPGWWTTMVGPGKPIDTDRFFVICANVIGGCMGSTGPAEIDPADGKPWGLNFPLVTIRDMVRAQKRLVEHLGIDKLLAVVGGSMGGMQALQWAASYPDCVRAVVPIACAARHSAQNIAFHEVGRQAIMADPDWQGGEYQLHGTKPVQGPGGGAHGRAHHLCFGDGAAAQIRPQPAEPRGASRSSSRRISRSNPICITRAPASSTALTPTPISTSPAPWIISTWPRSMAGNLSDVFRLNPARFCIISFTSDWLFPPVENKRIAHALNAVAAQVSFVEIKSDKGHDAFLLDEPEMFATVRGFLNHAAAGLHEHDDAPLASRPCGHRRHDPPRRAGAGCRLRRRRAAGASERPRMWMAAASRFPRPM